MRRRPPAKRPQPLQPQRKPRLPKYRASGLGDLPRNETLIADILTGRVGSPTNFNDWVGWKWRDRGMQNLANEPLWSVDFATGEIINGLADGDPVYNDDFTALTIPLRQGVTWSDGEPFTAADVVFTVETLMANRRLQRQQLLCRQREVGLGARRLHGRLRAEQAQLALPHHVPRSLGRHLDHAQAHLGIGGRSGHLRVQPVCRHRPLQAAQL